MSRGTRLAAMVLGVLFPCIVGCVSIGAAETAPREISMTWGPLPAGWTARFGNINVENGDKGEAPSTGRAVLKAQGLFLNFHKGKWSSSNGEGGTIVEIGCRRMPEIRTLEDYSSKMVHRASGGELTVEQLKSMYKISEVKFQDCRAFKTVGNMGNCQRQTGYLVEVDAANSLWVVIMADTRFSSKEADRSNRDTTAYMSRCMTDLEALLKTFQFGQPLKVEIETAGERPFSFRLKLKTTQGEQTGGGERDEKKLIAEKLKPYHEVRLLAHVFDRDFNVLKVDDRFKVNGDWKCRMQYLRDVAPPTAPFATDPGVSESSATLSSALPPSAEEFQKASKPIPLELDGQYEASMELIVSFAKLAQWSSRYAAHGVNVPQLGKPTRVTLDVDLVGKDEKNKEVVIASGTKTATLDYVARVLGVRFEEPTIQNPKQFEMFGRGDLLPRRCGALSDYASAPCGDLKGSRRVLIDRKSDSHFGTIGQSGSTPGVPLVAGDLLRPTDVIYMDPRAMVAYGVIDPPQPMRVTAGCVAVRMVFADGLQTELMVYQDAGLWHSVIGGSPEETGFSSEGMKWAYFAGDFSIGQVKDAVLEWTAEKLLPDLAPGLAVFNTAKDVFEVASFISEKVNVQHVRLNSKVFGKVDSAGRFHLTTRQGAPVVYSKTTGPKGLVVRNGKTAILDRRDPPVVRDTDTATARFADERLAGRLPEVLKNPPGEKKKQSNDGGTSRFTGSREAGPGSGSGSSESLASDDPIEWVMDHLWTVVIAVVVVIGTVVAGFILLIWLIFRRPRRAVVAARMQTQVPGPPGPPLSPQPPPRAVGFCTQCGAALAGNPSPRFCPRCGSAVKR